MAPVRAQATGEQRSHGDPDTELIRSCRGGNCTADIPERGSLRRRIGDLAIMLWRGRDILRSRLLLRKARIGGRHTWALDNIRLSWTGSTEHRNRICWNRNVWAHATAHKRTLARGTVVQCQYNEMVLRSKGSQT